MSIIKYSNNIFTHDGQSTVEEFISEIGKAKETIASIKPLLVISGYHGDSEGKIFIKFSNEEIEATKKAATNFPYVELIIVDTEMTDEEIRKACKNGNVFFTWCDSDTRVRKVMSWQEQGQKV